MFSLISFLFHCFKNFSYLLRYDKVKVLKQFEICIEFFANVFQYLAKNLYIVFN